MPLNYTIDSRIDYVRGIYLCFSTCYLFYWALSPSKSIKYIFVFIWCWFHKINNRPNGKNPTFYVSISAFSSSREFSREYLWMTEFTVIFFCYFYTIYNINTCIYLTANPRILPMEINILGTLCFMTCYTFFMIYYCSVIFHVKFYTVAKTFCGKDSYAKKAFVHVSIYIYCFKSIAFSQNKHKNQLYGSKRNCCWISIDSLAMRFVSIHSSVLSLQSRSFISKQRDCVTKCADMNMA